MSFSTNFLEFSARLSAFISSSQSGPASTTANSCREEHFAELAQELFARQFESNEPYRNFCLASGVQPQNVGHWSRIPAVPTSAFKEFEFSVLPRDECDTVFFSSGTTHSGPSRHFHNRESLEIYETSLLTWFEPHLLPDQSRNSTRKRPMICLTPSAEAAPHSSLAHMLQTIRSAFGSSDSIFLGSVEDDEAWTLDSSAASEALQRAAYSSERVILLGTAFSFVHLLDMLAEQDLLFALPTGSRVMETGGYKGRSRTLPKKELYSQLSHRLGVPTSHIISEYGMSELSSQAYDHAIDRGLVTRQFTFPPWTRTQLISPETGREVPEGEAGLIRIWDLANVYSVMAIQTEDLAIRRATGFELIGRATASEPRGCSLMAR